MRSSRAGVRLLRVPRLPTSREIEDQTPAQGSQFKQPLLEFSGACAGCAANLLRAPDHAALRRPTCTSPTLRAVLRFGVVLRRASPYTVNNAGSWPGVVELAVRGQRRARHGYAARLRGRERHARSRRREAHRDWRRDRRCRRRPGVARGSQRRAMLLAKPPMCSSTELSAIAAGVAARWPSWRPGDPREQGLPVEEVHLDLRRRRLGVRHRLRRFGPRARVGRRREHVRVRHRGVLQHRRPGFQGFQHRPGCAVRCRRQGQSRRSRLPRSR